MEKGRCKGERYTVIVARMKLASNIHHLFVIVDTVLTFGSCTAKPLKQEGAITVIAAVRLSVRICSPRSAVRTEMVSVLTVLMTAADALLTVTVAVVSAGRWCGKGWCGTGWVKRLR
jgi:hypothetical protein